MNYNKVIEVRAGHLKIGDLAERYTDKNTLEFNEIIDISASLPYKIGDPGVKSSTVKITFKKGHPHTYFTTTRINIKKVNLKKILSEL